MGNWTLEQFLTHVDEVQTQMRRAGVVTVYFQHDTLTPGNIRARWDDVPVRDVPAVGAVLDLPGAGYMGADVRWKVAADEWLAGPGVVLTMTEAED